MGKRIKPSNLVENVQAEVPSADAAASKAEEFVDTSLVGNGVITPEAKAKLEKYDALEKSVASLAKEKEVLEAKVAEYAEKLADMKAAKKEDSSTKLAEALKAKEVAEKEVGALKLENKALRDEADGYLVKISELTFDNARLTCELDEASKHLKEKGTVPNQPQYMPKPNNAGYNPYLANGYSSWN